MIMKTKPDPRRLRNLAHTIAKELLTVSLGRGRNETGTRMAIMQGVYPREKNLGGRDRICMEEEILSHLSKL